MVDVLHFNSKINYTIVAGVVTFRRTTKNRRLSECFARHFTHTQFICFLKRHSFCITEKNIWEYVSGTSCMRKFYILQQKSRESSKSYQRRICIEMGTLHTFRKSAINLITLNVQIIVDKCT